MLPLKPLLEPALDAALQPVSHDPDIGEADTTEALRARRLKRVAVIAGITLVILIVLAIGIYVDAFVILSPTMG
jgi:hypothetical protein